MKTKLIDDSSKIKAPNIIGDATYWIQQIYQILQEFDERITKMEKK